MCALEDAEGVVGGVRRVSGVVQCPKNAKEAIYTFLVKLDPDRLAAGLLPYEFKSEDLSLNPGAKDDFPLLLKSFDIFDLKGKETDQVSFTGRAQLGEEVYTQMVSLTLFRLKHVWSAQ